eukprot:5505530-Amphidinium_carterae.1
MAMVVDEKGPTEAAIKGVLTTLQNWGCKKLVFRVDNEPAIVALFQQIASRRKEESVLETRPRYSSPSLGPVENANKEVKGILRAFIIYLREHAEYEITAECVLLP